jgi:hypothetical protein
VATVIFAHHVFAMTLIRNSFRFPSQHFPFTCLVLFDFSAANAPMMHVPDPISGEESASGFPCAQQSKSQLISKSYVEGQISRMGTI